MTRIALLMAATCLMAAPAHAERFDGVFRFVPDKAQVSIVHADAKDAVVPPLPAFSLQVVDAGDRLYPLSVFPLTGAGDGWEVIAGPGYVDGKDITFSLTLKEPAANCLHNGSLTLAFDDKGVAPEARYRFAAETCAYLKFDMSGTATVSFAPGVADDKAALLAREADIAAHRLPVRPLADLKIGDGPFAKPFAGEASDPALSYGFVVDGVVYAGGCETRAGADPLCGDLLLPSYSTAKTLFGAVGVMRLEKLTPGVADTPVRDLVPECKSWGDVRLVDALDMATGRYGSAAYMADEGSAEMEGFLASPGHGDRITHACGHDPRQGAPGTTFVYRTSDTYVLGTAMQAAAHKDLYDGVLRPLWRELHLGRQLDYIQRTNDAAAQPYAGYGMVYRRDDILRMALWFFGEAPQLDAKLHAEALSGQGLMAFPPDYRYRYGVWSRNIAGPAGCARETWVPFMSGYGGITVARLSPRILFYTFGDSHQFDWTAAITAATRIEDLCA